MTIQFIMHNAAMFVACVPLIAILAFLLSRSSHPANRRVTFVDLIVVFTTNLFAGFATSVGVIPTWAFFVITSWMFVEELVILQRGIE